jgi:hypothetical protein
MKVERRKEGIEPSVSKRIWPSLAVVLLAVLIVPIVGPSEFTEAGTILCAGHRATITGTAKGEVIRGTPGNDVIHARGGNDVVRGGGGADIICGGSGSDLLVGGPGRDELRGESGNDELRGQGGVDKLAGGGGRDLLNGGKRIDRINGGRGTDSCYRTTAARRSKCEKSQLWTRHWAALKMAGDRLSYTEAAGGTAPMALDVPQLADLRFQRAIGCTFLDAPGDYCDWRFTMPNGVRRFAARVGGDPRFVDGTVARYELIGDGRLIASKVVGLGDVGTIKAPIAGVDYLILRIRYDRSVADPSPTEFHLWADPRIGYHPRLQPACAIAPSTSSNPVPTCTSEL